MFCPKCAGEYREGFYECSDCGVALVEESPAGSHLEASGEATPVNGDLVTVFVIEDAAIVPVVKSVLEDASIQYFMKGEGLQDLFGWGRCGTGYNLVVGPIEIQVEEEREAQARALLSQLGTRE